MRCSRADRRRREVSPSLLPLAQLPTAILIQRSDGQVILFGVPDGGLQRVGQRNRRTVGCVKRKQRNTFRQAFDGREHAVSFVGRERLDVRHLTAAKPRQFEFAHNR